MLLPFIPTFNIPLCLACGTQTDLLQSIPSYGNLQNPPERLSKRRSACNLAVAMFCVGFDGQNEIRGEANSYDTFRISEERSASYNSMSRWVANNRKHGRRGEGSEGKEKTNQSILSIMYYKLLPVDSYLAPAPYGYNMCRIQCMFISMKLLHSPLII